MIKSRVAILLVAVCIAGLFVALLHAADFTIPAGYYFSADGDSLNLPDEDVNNAGTVVVTNGTVTVGGDWLNTGLFTSTNATVGFSSSSRAQSVTTGGTSSAFSTIAITNSHPSGVTFNDALYCGTLTASTGVKKLSFGASGIHTVSSRFNVNGASGNVITLAPAVASTAWYLDAPSTTVGYLDVSYSREASGKSVVAQHSTTGGNNENWVFPPVAVTGASAGTTSGSATLYGTVTANGGTTTSWFDYGTVSGVYTGSSTAQSVTGSSATAVGISLSGLSASTTYYYRISAQNDAGASTGSEASFATTAETVAPAGSLQINSGVSYTTSAGVTLNLSATDTVGVTGYYVSSSSSPPLAGAAGWTSVTSTTSYTANVSYTLSGSDGSKTIYAWYKDVAGNVSGAANASITLDTASPTGSVTINGGASAASSTTASLTLSATDTYGVSQMQFSNDNSTWSSAETYATTRTWMLAAGDGAKMVYVKYKDNAGNWSGAYNDTITLDSVAPVGSLNVNSGAWYTGTTTVTLNLSATDSVGVAGYYVSETSTTPSAGAGGWVTVTTTTGYSANALYTLSGGDGSKMVYAWYKDTADTISSSASKSIVLDATTPTVASTYPANNGTGLALNGVITATFSEVMDPATVGTSTFTFNGGTGTVSYSGTTASFTPALSLDYATMYTGTITTGVKDLAGNAMESAYSWRFTSLAIPPTVTTGLATNVTANSATFNGVVNANGTSTTAWFNYGTVSGVYTGTSTTQSVNGTSSTSVAISAGSLPESTAYYCRIAAQNGAGTSYGSETAFATADGTAPAGTLIVNSGASYTTSAAVTLNLSATDAVGVTGYYISAGSTAPLAGASGWASITSTTSYTANVSYTLSGSDGSKTVYAWYKDAAGNVSDATSDSITLDTIAPTVSLDAVTSPTNVASQTITGVVEAGATVSVATNTAASDGAATVSGATWSYTITGLAAGANGITVTATDAAGNTATTTGSITLDTTAPTVSMNTVTSPTNVTSQTITGAVEAGATVSVATNTAASDGAATVSGTTWSYTITGLVAGANGITVTATDAAGNMATATGSITLDMTAPTVSLNTVTSPTNVTSQTITGAVEAGATVSVVTNTAASDGAATVSGATWSYTITGLVAGANGITVTATDTAGNTATATGSITLDTVAPTVSMTPETAMTNLTSYTITGAVEAGATVSVVTNTAASDGAATVTGATWSYTITGLVVGVNGITVTATDTAGNTATVTGSVTLDTEAPSVSMNAVVSPTKVTSQTITGAVGEGATVSVATDTAASDGAASVSGITWSYTITGLVEGANGVTVTAADTAGNTATATGSITLDMTAPTVSLNAVTSPTNAAKQTITGTVESGATVSVATDTAASDGAATVSGTTWSYTITGLVAGANGITVTATDTAGNTATATGSITLDSGSPVVAITSPTSNADYTTTSSIINLGGTAVDGGSGLAGVSWSDTRGNNGAASGTTSWSISGIPLSLGENTITVTATDVAGNTGADTIVVTYATAPTVATGIAASVTLSSAILNGRASANGAETTVWFEYGVSSGSYSKTTPVQTISGTSTTGISGSIQGLEEMTTYYCRIAAQNSAGTTYGSATAFLSRTQTSAGYAHSLALTSNGSVRAWGDNQFGQLGDGTNKRKLTPEQISGFGGVIDVVAGMYHSLALKSDGTVWAWGKNGDGELGNGTNTNSSVPVQVSNLSGIMAIAGGDSFSLAVKSDGTVWAWGNNGNGQLGNGTNADSNTPVQVSGLSGAIAIAAGGSHSVALTSDGMVWAWGHNNDGQLGDGTLADKWTPVQSGGLSGIAAIAAGWAHNLVLKPDGAVWTWGNNAYGQLGDGTTMGSNVPVQVRVPAGVAFVATGGYYSFALKSDGTGWVWGDNRYGQLGDGTTTQRTSPVPVDLNTELVVRRAIKDRSYGERRSSSLYKNVARSAKKGRQGVTALSGEGNSVLSIECGFYHNQVIKSGGAVIAWGRNEFGQLGDGTTTDSLGPVQVENLNLSLDTTPPAVSLNTVTSPTNVESQTLTGAVEAGATVSVTTDTVASDGSAAVSGATWSYTVTGLAEGVNGITVTAMDTAGNTATATGSIRLDRIAPVGSVSINDNTPFTLTRAVTLNLAATDSVGVAGYYISETSTALASGADGWTSVTSTASYQADVSFTLSDGDGVRRVYAWYKDAAGNVSVAASGTITLNEKPVVTSYLINGGAAQSSGRTVALNNVATGNPTQCMASESVYFSDAVWQTYSEALPFTLSAGDGAKTVYFKVKKVNGESEVVSGVITLNELPVVTGYQINKGATWTTSRAVTLSNTATGNPVEYLASEDAGFSGASWQSYTVAPAFTLSEGYGEKTVYFKVKNGNGESAALSDGITFKELPVVTSFLINNGAADTVSSTVTLNHTATGSPAEYMASESSSFTGSSWRAYIASPPFTLSAGDGKKTVYFKVKNANGESAAVSDVIMLNKLPAVTLFQINNGETDTVSRTVTLNNVATRSPAYYMASESASFAGAAWQPYSAAPSFTLSAGDGRKTVYLKVKNTDGESPSVNDSITLKELPVVTLFRINGGAVQTTSQTVTLNNTATGGPTEYMASESAAFADAAWLAYSDAPSFTLSQGEGEKTVYCKVRNGNGVSAAVSDVITFNKLPVVARFQINNGASGTVSRTVTLNNAVIGSPTHYMASESSTFADGAWRAYLDTPVFTLSAGDGEKTVYFKVKNASGDSEPVSDGITLNRIPVVTQFQINLSFTHT